VKFGAKKITLWRGRGLASTKGGKRFGPKKESHMAKKRGARIRGDYDTRKTDLQEDEEHKKQKGANASVRNARIGEERCGRRWETGERARLQALKETLSAAAGEEINVPYGQKRIS